MDILKQTLDMGCQLAILFLMLGGAWWLFQHAKPQAGSLSLLERWAALKDDDQLMALAVLLVIVCIPTATGLVIFVLVTHPTGYDTLVGSLVTSLMTLGGVGMLYFFNQGHSGKKSAAALADLAAETKDPKTDPPAAAAP